MKKIKSVLSMVVLLVSAGCSKNETPGPATKTSLLTSAAWRMTSMTANPGIDDGTGRLVTDQFAILPNCVKDNLLRFENPNTLVYDEGTTKCNSSDSQTSSTTWAFNTGETAIIISQAGYPLQMTLIELTSNKLTYSYPMGTSSGTSIITETRIRN